MNLLTPYKLRLKNGSFREGAILQTEKGFGDIAPLPGFSSETLAEAINEAETLLPDFPHAKPTLPSVQFAFSCAQIPLKSVKVPVNALNVIREGFSVVKIKVGHLSIEEAIEEIKHCKHCSIRLDFNQQWPLEKLLKFSSYFSPTDFAYLEEPTKEFSDLLLFSEKTRFPIAVDESIPHVPYWQIPTLKALVIKPTILGFIPEKIPGIEQIFSSAFESGIGVTHIAILAAEINPLGVHGLDPYTHFCEDVLSPKPTIERGIFSWTAP
jgi:O-succinylbenzoate synthase